MFKLLISIRQPHGSRSNKLLHTESTESSCHTFLSVPTITRSQPPARWQHHTLAVAGRRHLLPNVPNRDFSQIIALQGAGRGRSPFPRPARQSGWRLPRRAGRRLGLRPGPSDPVRADPSPRIGGAGVCFVRGETQKDACAGAVLHSGRYAFSLAMRTNGRHCCSGSGRCASERLGGGADAGARRRQARAAAAPPAPTSLAA